MKCSCGVCALKFNLDNLQVVGHSLGCALCYSSRMLTCFSQKPAENMHHKDLIKFVSKNSWRLCILHLLTAPARVFSTHVSPL